MTVIKLPRISFSGPFWCAHDSLEIALRDCTIKPELISVSELESITYSTALTGTIDDPSYLDNDRVYLFSGTLDSVVVPGVMEKLAVYYSNFISTGLIYSMFSIPAQHAIVSGHVFITSHNVFTRVLAAATNSFSWGGATDQAQPPFKVCISIISVNLDATPAGCYSGCDY